MSGQYIYIFEKRLMVREIIEVYVIAEILLVVIELGVIEIIRFLTMPV